MSPSNVRPSWVRIFKAIRAVAGVIGAIPVLLLLFVTLNPIWRPHALNLCLRTWENFLVTEGSSTAGTISNLLSGVVIVGLTVVLILRHRGPEEMRRHWREEAPIAIRVVIMASLIVYGPVLLWKFADAIYRDHLVLSMMNRNMHGCWMSNLGMKPPATLPTGMASGDVIVFWCSTDFSAPLSVEWEFDKAPKSISVPFFTDVLAISANAVLNGNTVVAYVDRPSILGFHPVAINAYSDEKLAPQARKVTLRTVSNDSKPVPTVIDANDLR